MPYCDHFTEALSATGFRTDHERATGVGSARWHCPNCNFVLYENPKPTVSVLVVDGRRILLGRRQSDVVEGGKWDTAGGFIEAGEGPEEAARRETSEEMGVDVSLTELFGAFKDSPYGPWKQSIVTIHYLGRIVNGQPRAGDDIAEVRWFAAEELPEDLAFRANRMSLNNWLATLGLPPRYTD